MVSLNLKLFIVLGFATLGSKSVAAINDLYPGDYVAAPAGQSAFAVYSYHRESEGVFSGGLSSKEKRRENSMAIFLAARYFDLFSMRSAISGSAGYAVQSTTDLISKVKEQTDGLTDPKISITFWPFIDQEKFRFFAVNAAYIFGSGSYDTSASQNIGQNRDRSSLSLAWVQRSYSFFTLEVTGELAWYGTNKNFRSNSSSLDQRSTQSVTTFLRYQLNEVASPYLGFRRIWGGETLVNGVAQGDSAAAERAYVGLRLLADQRNIVHIRAEADTKLFSGYKLTQGLSVRWTTLR